MKVNFLTLAVGYKKSNQHLIFPELEAEIISYCLDNQQQINNQQFLSTISQTIHQF